MIQDLGVRIWVPHKNAVGSFEGGKHMTEKKPYHRLAEISGMGHSKAMQKLLECAMTEDEARLVLELPASSEDLAAKFNLTHETVDAKLYDLAQRGIVAPLESGLFHFNNIPAILHDNMFSSLPEKIPEGLSKVWLELYDGEQYWRDLAEMYDGFEAPILRVIPAEKSISTDIKLLPQESMTEIIETNQDLISVRNCCCRNSAKKCHHPLDVCIQFKARAEYDLYRGAAERSALTKRSRLP